jgi:hypothetical protein
MQSPVGWDSIGECHRKDDSAKFVEVRSGDQ